MRITSILTRTLTTLGRDALVTLLAPLLIAGPLLVIAYHRYQHVLVKYGYDDTPLQFAISGLDVENLLLLLVVGVVVAGPLAHRTYHRCSGRRPTALESLRTGLRGSAVAAGLALLLGILTPFCVVFAAMIAHPVHRLGWIDPPFEAWMLLGTFPVVALGARLSLAVPLATLPRPDGDSAFRRSWDRTATDRARITGLGTIWFYAGAIVLILPLHWFPRWWTTPDAWCAARAVWFGACFLMGVVGVILASVTLGEIGAAEGRLEPSSASPEESRDARLAR